MPKVLRTLRWNTTTDQSKMKCSQRSLRSSLSKGANIPPLQLDPPSRIGSGPKRKVNYCKEVVSRLKSTGIRAELCHGEGLPKLIRNVEKQKVPLMTVVGPKEVETRTVTVRSRFGGELGTMTVDEFISRVEVAVENKTRL